MLRGVRGVFSWQVERLSRLFDRIERSLKAARIQNKRGLKNSLDLEDDKREQTVCWNVRPLHTIFPFNCVGRAYYLEWNQSITTEASQSQYLN